MTDTKKKAAIFKASIGKGKCRLCKKVVGRSASKKHLLSCIDSTLGAKEGGDTYYLLYCVAGPYWMYLTGTASARY